MLAHDFIEVGDGEFAVAVEVAGVEGAGAFVAAVDRLEVLLFEQARDEVVGFSLGRMLFPEERVKPLRAFPGVARAAAPDLVVNALELVALRAAVVTAGGGGEVEVEQHLLRFLRAMGCWTEGSVGADAAQIYDPEQKVACLEAAAHLGVDLVEDVRERPALVDQVEERAAFAERMKHLVIVQKDEWPFEYAFWVKQNRL